MNNGYATRQTMKVTRTVHVVRFGPRTKALDLKHYLASVPDDAVVVEAGTVGDTDQIEIEFIQETADGTG